MTTSRKGEKKNDKDTRARAILEAAVPGTDQAVCKKYGINARTLRRWKQEVRTGTDHELTAAVRSKREAQDKAWGERIPEALANCLEFISRAAKTASPKDPDVIHAIAGAMKMIAETDNTYKLIDARVSGQDRENREASGSVPAGSNNVTPFRRTGTGT